MRVLIANRGEIARRIIRTAMRLGHETVAVYADPDRAAPYTREANLAVHLGPADLTRSYLDMEGLLAAAARAGANAIHPGYGFLSESAAFARAATDAGLIWVGPHADAIERMGSKITARGLAAAAGVPTVRGFDASQEPAELAAAAARIGFPVLVKAAAGGGGRGIRIVCTREDFPAALGEAAQEAERSFGNGGVIVERYLERARHIEVQVVGDRHGNVVDLGTRECSVQRRYQKLLEEAPAPNLPDATQLGLRVSARELAQSIAYDSVGTVEFVVDADTGEHFFLEMNTRLQVEHPVTEAITGLDLVELQLRSAEGAPLPLTQGDVVFRGHAFEARINAEDANAGFAPQVGCVTDLQVPAGVRWESDLEVGSEVSPYYDSMVAKLVVDGPDRDVARRRMSLALDSLLIGGLVTNTGFHRWLIETPEVVSGRVTTSFLESAAFPGAAELSEAIELAAAAWWRARQGARSSGPWSALESFRVTAHRPAHRVTLMDRHDVMHDVDAGVLATGTPWEAGDVSRRASVAVDLPARRVALNLAGETHTFRVVSRSERWAASPGAGVPGRAEATRAPFPAVVTETPVAAGESVLGGDVVVVIEAMKMLHSLSAKGAGVVESVHVRIGDSVESKQLLVNYQPELSEETRSGGT